MVTHRNTGMETSFRAREKNKGATIMLITTSRNYKERLDAHAGH